MVLNITVRVARAARSRSVVDCHRDLGRGGGPGQAGWLGTSDPGAPRGLAMALQAGTAPSRMHVPTLSLMVSTSTRQADLTPISHDCNETCVN